MDLIEHAQKLIQERRGRLRRGAKYEPLKGFIEVLVDDDWSVKAITEEILKLPSHKGASAKALYAWTARYVRRYLQHGPDATQPKPKKRPHGMA